MIGCAAFLRCSENAKNLGELLDLLKLGVAAVDAVTALLALLFLGGLGEGLPLGIGVSQRVELVSGKGHAAVGALLLAQAGLEASGLAGGLPIHGAVTVGRDCLGGEVALHTAQHWVR